MTSGQAGSGTQFKLDLFTAIAVMGGVLIVSGVLQFIDDLNDGGDYAFWFGLTDFAWLAAVGVLVLLCATHLENKPWTESLRRAAPALGIAVAVASVALAVRDATEEFNDTFWDPVNDLFYYIPLTVAAVIYLSSVRRSDRVVGSPSQWGRILAVVALVVGLIITINDVSEAGNDEFWVFLSSLAQLSALALFLLAVTLEQNLTQAQGSLKLNEVLNDARLPDWIAIGAVAIAVAGVLLAIKALDAPVDGFWLFLQELGFYVALAGVVLVASRGRVGTYLRSDHPYVRYALIGALVVMFLVGLKFTADADSDQFWVFLNECTEYPAFAVLGFAMYEASRRLPSRVDA